MELDDTQLQFDENGRLRHLLSLKGLDASLITGLMDEAEDFLTAPGELPARSRSLAGRTVGNLFFEPSTRTRASFDLAGRRLGADVLNLDVNTSSRKKGESILDTIYTLEAMQVDIMVVRDASDGVPAYIARHVEDHVSVLNAGESDVSHPTQGRRHRWRHPAFTRCDVSLRSVADDGNRRVTPGIAAGTGAGYGQVSGSAYRRQHR